MSWIWTIFAVVMLVLLHELGHFVAAKRLGMRVERFSVSSAAAAAPESRRDRVRSRCDPRGRLREDHRHVARRSAALPPELAARAYYNQPPWKRIVVILAGPGVNILIAFLLFWIVLYSGSLDGASALQNANPGLTTIARSEKVVSELVAGEPTAAVLKTGDRIVAINGKPANAAAAVTAIRATHCAGPEHQPGRHDAGQRRRKGTGRRPDSRDYPRYVAKAKRMMIGVGFGLLPTQAKQFGVLGAGVAAVGEMWHITVASIGGLGKP